jgi:uncharacterized protein (DUF697 family)
MTAVTMVACLVMVLVGCVVKGGAVPRLIQGLPLTFGVCVSAGGIATVTFAICKRFQSCHNNAAAILQHGMPLLDYSLPH